MSTTLVMNVPEFLRSKVKTASFHCENALRKLAVLIRETRHVAEGTCSLVLRFFAGDSLRF